MNENLAKEEDGEIDRLVRFLKRPGPRFGLALAIYRDPVVAREIRDRIEHRVMADGLVLRTLSLDYEDATKDLVARMANTSHGADGLFLTGIDSLLIDGAGRPDPSPSILDLNVRRDELPDALDARVVLWMSKAGYRSFRDNAWDLHEVILTMSELERSAILPQPAPTVLELPSWFRSVDPEHALAIKSRAEALARATEGTSDPRTRADAASSTARAYLDGGWLDEGMEWLEQAALAYEQLRDLDRAAIERLRLAEVLEIRGDLEPARCAAECARDLSATLGNEHDEALATSKIADIRRAEGRTDESLAILRDRVLPVFERLGDGPGQAATATKIADILQANGKLDEALELLRQQVLPLYQRLGNVREQAATMVRIAGMLEVRGDLEQALRTLQEGALPLYERVGAAGNAAAVLGRIADVLAARKEHDRAHRIRAHDQLPEFERSGAGRARGLAVHKLEQRARLPGVLLAFADSGHGETPPRGLSREERGIRAALEPVTADGRLGDIVTLWNATVYDIVDAFRKERLRGRIRVLHLGGYTAKGAELILADDGVPSVGLVLPSLAEYLGREEGLVLVVLSGSSTAPQVERLRHAGVKAVVAPSQAITDDVAVDFSVRFYEELTRSPLKAAFDYATASVRGKHGAGPRDLVHPHGAQHQEWPWILSCDQGYEEWMLIGDDGHEHGMDVDPHAFVEALAGASHDSDTALVLLSRAGFPRERIPRFDSPLEFWSRVVHELHAGVITGGVQRLVSEAARMYPGNEFFRRFAQDPRALR